MTAASTSKAYAHDVTMEELTNAPWPHAWPPCIDEFFAGGYERCGRVYDETFARDVDGKGVDVREIAGDAHADEIRKFAREMMAHERAMGFDGVYTPGEDSEWTREDASLDPADPANAERMKEEDDPTSESARERRCANALLDMVDEDLHACTPALEMFTRMDQNIDAFEAFVRDMRRRFDAGTLPKRDVLGNKMLFKWRALVLSVIAVWIAVSVTFLKWIYFVIASFVTVRSRI